MYFLSNPGAQFYLFVHSHQDFFLFFATVILDLFIRYLDLVLCLSSNILENAMLGYLMSCTNQSTPKCIHAMEYENSCLRVGEWLKGSGFFFWKKEKGLSVT